MSCPNGYGAPPTAAADATPASSAYRRLGGMLFQATAASAGSNRASALPVASTAVGVSSRLPGPGAEDVMQYSSRVHDYLRELHEAHGDTVLLRRGGEDVVMVRGPEAIRRVLLDEDFAKTWDSDKTGSVEYVNNLVQPVLAGSIFSMHGQENFERRKLIRPAMTGSPVFMPSFVAVIEDDVVGWADGVVDIQDLAHNLIRKTVITTLAGDEARSFAYTCIDTFHEVMEYFVDRYSVVTTTPVVTEQDEVMMQKLKDAALEVVVAFRGRFGCAVGCAASVAAMSDATRCSILNVMMQVGTPDDELAATFVNVVIAAAEAPGSALAQLLEELGSNPELQEKLRAVTAAAPAGGAELVAFVEQNEYVKKVVLEGLRRFAPATIVQRAAVTDTEIGGVKIAKGQVVVMCPHAIHMDAQQFPEPEKFDEERSGNVHTRLGKEQSFMTFSGGQRGCPGRHLALSMMLAACVVLPRQFEFYAAPRDSKGRDADFRRGMETKGASRVPKFVEWQVDGIPLGMRRRTR